MFPPDTIAEIEENYDVFIKSTDEDFFDELKDYLNDFYDGYEVVYTSRNSILIDTGEGDSRHSLLGMERLENGMLLVYKPDFKIVCDAISINEDSPCEVCEFEEECDLDVKESMPVFELWAHKHDDSYSSVARLPLPTFNIKR